MQDGQTMRRVARSTEDQVAGSGDMLAACATVMTVTAAVVARVTRVARPWPVLAPRSVDMCRPHLFEVELACGSTRAGCLQFRPVCLLFPQHTYYFIDFVSLRFPHSTDSKSSVPAFYR